MFDFGFGSMKTVFSFSLPFMLSFYWLVRHSEDSIWDPAGKGKKYGTTGSERGNYFLGQDPNTTERTYSIEWTG